MNIFTKSFKLFNLLDVRVEIQLLLLIFIGISVLVNGLFALLFLSALLFSITLHEYGHIMAARAYNISCYRVLLTPIGGIAFINFQETAYNYNAKREFIIAAAGPLFSLVLGALFLSIGKVFDGAFISTIGNINLLIFLFNLIPAYPMDGGRIFKSITKLIVKNYYQASRITGIVGMLFSALITSYFLFKGAFITAMIGIFIGVQSYAEYKNNVNK